MGISGSEKRPKVELGGDWGIPCVVVEGVQAVDVPSQGFEGVLVQVVGDEEEAVPVQMLGSQSQVVDGIISNLGASEQVFDPVLVVGATPGTSTELLEAMGGHPSIPDGGKDGREHTRRDKLLEGGKVAEKPVGKPLNVCISKVGRLSEKWEPSRKLMADSVVEVGVVVWECKLVEGRL